MKIICSWKVWIYNKNKFQLTKKKINQQIKLLYNLIQRIIIIIIKQTHQQLQPQQQMILFSLKMDNIID